MFELGGDAAVDNPGGDDRDENEKGEDRDQDLGLETEADGRGILHVRISGDWRRRQRNRRGLRRLREW